MKKPILRIIVAVIGLIILAVVLFQVFFSHKERPLPASKHLEEAIQHGLRAEEHEKAKEHEDSLAKASFDKYNETRFKIQTGDSLLDPRRDSFLWAIIQRAKQDSIKNR